jgi:hypothetical protein
MTQEELRAYLDFMRTQPEDPLIPPPLMSLDENQRGTSWAPPGGWTRDYGPLTDAQKKAIAQAPSPPIPGTMSEWFLGVNPEPFRYKDLKDRLRGNYPQQTEKVTTPIARAEERRSNEEFGALQGFGPGRGRGDVFSGGGPVAGISPIKDEGETFRIGPDTPLGRAMQANIDKMAEEDLGLEPKGPGVYERDFPATIVPDEEIPEQQVPDMLIPDPRDQRLDPMYISWLGGGAYPGSMSNGIPTAPEMSPTTGWEQYADPTRLGGPHDVSPAGINTLLDSPRFDIPASPEADSLVVSTAKSLVGDITGLMRDVTREARGINLRTPGMSNWDVNVANTPRGSWDINLGVSRNPSIGLEFTANSPFASGVAETVFGAPVAVASAIGGALTSFFSGLGDKRSEGVTDLGYSDTPPSDFALTDSSQPRGSDLGYSENQGGEGNGMVGGTDDGTSGYDETDYDYDDEGDRY